MLILYSENCTFKGGPVCCWPWVTWSWTLDNTSSSHDVASCTEESVRFTILRQQVTDCMSQFNRRCAVLHAPVHVSLGSRTPTDSVTMQSYIMACRRLTRPKTLHEYITLYSTNQPTTETARPPGRCAGAWTPGWRSTCGRTTNWIGSCRWRYISRLSGPSKYYPVARDAQFTAIKIYRGFTSDDMP